MTSLLVAIVLSEPIARTLVNGPNVKEGIGYIINERVEHGKTFSLIGKSIYNSGSVSYGRKVYQMDGTPVSSSQEGEWNDRWNVLTSTFHKDYAEQSINGVVTRTKMAAREFRNPTALWFWKKQPKIGEVATVKFLAQNTIATFEIKYTYEGDETLTLAGREVKVHRVREDPLSAKGVYTIWWYDDQGMGVKRYHKTTTSEFRFELISWR